MATYLGLDFGEKRIGVAVSDEGARLATALTTLDFQGREKLLAEIDKLVVEYGISGIVAGLPKTMKGEIGPAAEKIQSQVAWLKERSTCEWILWDERLSTQEVERILIDADMSRARRKEVRDRLAAQRILQSYLDYQNRKGPGPSRDNS